VAESLVHDAWLRFAFVLLELCLKLRLGFFGIDHKLLPRAEHQLAHVAIRDTRRRSDKTCDLQIALSHAT